MKEKAFVYNAVAIVDPLEVQRIDRQLAARRTKLMKELRERISEVERRVGRVQQRSCCALDSSRDGIQRSDAG